MPWRGYFDFISSVDLFVVLDDVQYPVGRSWRNRNQVKTKDGLKWMTVPVQSTSEKLPIDQVLIARPDKPWQTKHRHLLQEALQKAEFGEEALQLWEDAIAAGDVKISELNIRLMKNICRYFGITTPLVSARQYKAVGTKTERLLNIIEATGATSYLSGPSARGYIDESMFRKRSIRLEYKTYDYLPYPQLWGPFEGSVSVIDLVANCGPKSRDLIRTRTPNEVAVP
jgi:hypothetical protein